MEVCLDDNEFLLRGQIIWIELYFSNGRNNVVVEDEYVYLRLRLALYPVVLTPEKHPEFILQEAELRVTVISLRLQLLLYNVSLQ